LNFSYLKLLTRLIETNQTFEKKRKNNMAKGKRENIKLKSTESAHTYYTTKNKANTPQRLEFKKFDPTLRRHVLYRESK